MKLKRFAALGVLFAAVSLNTCFADNIDNDFWNWLINGIGNGGNYYNYDYNADYPTPVITSPSAYDTILSSDEVKIIWKYTGTEKCVVLIKNEEGYVSEIAAEEGNKARILPNKLTKGASYIITVKAGSIESEPFTLTVADDKEEIVEIISRTDVEKAEEKISREKIIPENAFDTKESANLFVKTVNVKVWKYVNNRKTTAEIPLTVNAELADTVVKIFDEIYQNQLHFPIKSASCYSYRTTSNGSRLSEHAYGTAIDINPDENYCVYSDGSVVGSLYEPYKNEYSVVPEIINIFRRYNFYWGGSFGDYMHFSYFGT